MEVCKIMRGIDRVDSQNLFPRVEMSNTRGHVLKVRGVKFKGDVRGKCFHTQSGRCLERAARGGGGGRYDRGG